MLSTSQMIRWAAKAGEPEVIVVTEGGLLTGLAAAAPETRFIGLRPPMICEDMKRTTLADVRDALRDLSGAVTVPAEVADPARASLERMTEIG